MSADVRRHDQRDPFQIMTTAQTITAHPQRQQPLLCPTDAKPAAPRKEMMASAERRPSIKTDKQSLEYLLKSGLAGGLAGCAVRLLTMRAIRDKSLTETHRQRQ